MRLSVAKPLVLEALLEGADRPDARQGQAATLDGVQPKAALVLRPQADPLAGLGNLQGQQLSLQALVAEGGELVLFFCPWLLRATLSVAPSWPCTQR